MSDYKQRAIEAQARARAARPAERMERFQQLMLFEHRSVLPNLAAKAALFAPVRPGRRRRTWEYEPVPTWGLEGIEVAYKHEQLNQHDLNVYLMLINFARRRGEDVAAFTRYEALRFLRTGTSGRNYQLLDDYIDRLQTTVIRISVDGAEEDQRRKYVLKDALVSRIRQEEHAGLYIVDISNALKGLFAIDDWCLINMEQRLELGANQWALAVHAFLSANKPPAWFSWEQIHQLWGQGYESGLKYLKRDFRKRVLSPLVEMNFITRVEEKDTAIGIWWKPSAQVPG